MPEGDRILHVDDEPGFAETVASLLEREYDRFTVETVTHPAAALERITQHEFDCVVADYSMPETDGIELLQAIRGEYPTLPVILYTGNGSEEVASTAIAEDVTDYVPKEIDGETYSVLADRIIDAIEDRRALANYEQIFEKIPDGVVIHDPETFEFVDMNQRYADMYGYDSKGDFLEAGFDTIHVGEPPYTMEKAKEHVQTALERGPQTFEWHAVRKDGSEFWAEVHLTPIHLHDQEQILAVVRDVTDRIQHETELERTNERLEEFASIVSHDLRNPLRVAETSVELLQERYNDENLDRVVRAHTRMRNLIEDLLLLARGGNTTDFNEIPLADLATTSWENVRIDSADLIVKTDQRVLADHTRLQQSLENLFRNAVEHAGEAPTITIGQIADGFYVEDDGRGIPEEHRDEIFNVGFTTSSVGTGYGLNIVKEIADEHEWEIEVTDSETGGARFEFTGVESTT